MIICMWAGGLQTSPTDGARYVQGMNTLGSLADSTLYPSVTGQRRLVATFTSGAHELYIPDQSVNSFPANAFRTWLAMYIDIVIEDTYIVQQNWDTETQKGAKIASLRFGSVTRDLRIYGIMNYSINGLNPGTSTTTYTATTLTDTTGTPFGIDYTGRWVVTSGGKKMLITSNTGNVLTGLGGWIDSTPSAGSPYTIQSAGYPQYRYKVADNAGTVIATGQARTPSRVNTTPVILDFQWVASTIALSNTVSLRVNGIIDSGISAVTGGTTANPATSTISVVIGALLVGAKGTFGGHGSLLSTGYAYDDLAQAGFNTYPKYSSTPPAHGAGSSRPVIACRQPLAGGTPKTGYDQWAKTGGADAGTVLDEAPDNNAADYIEESTLNEKQAIPHELLAGMTIPAYSHDSFYAVQSIGYAKNSALAASLKVFFANATGDDAGITHVNTSASANLVYCAILDPSAVALTLATIEAMQTVVQNGNSGVVHRVESAAQLVLFTQGVAGSEPVSLEPRQARGTRGRVMRRGVYDHIDAARPDAMLRDVREIRETIERVERNELVKV